HSSSTSIANNIFYAPITGWGVQTASGFSGLIANNTFALNMRNNGGMIMLWDKNGSITVRNNIFHSPTGGFAINSSSLTLSGGCSIDHNLIFGGWVGAVSGCSTTNNMIGDPAFVNIVSPPYDFHLQPWSIAVGQGASVAGLNSDF